MALKSNDIESAGHKVFEPQLNAGIRCSTGTRIDQADGLHRSEAQSVATAPGEHFYGQAALEIFLFVRHTGVWFDGLGGEQSFIETVVLLFRQRAIDIIGSAFAVRRAAT